MKTRWWVTDIPRVPRTHAEVDRIEKKLHPMIMKGTLPYGTTAHQPCQNARVALEYQSAPRMDQVKAVENGGKSAQLNT